MPAQKPNRDTNKNKQTYPLTNTGSIYYSSDDVESASEVERFIFKMLYDRHLFISNTGNKEMEALNYLSLDEILKELDGSSLSPKERTLEKINLALEDILKISDQGKNRMGYLYPVLDIENKNLKVKLALIAPQVDAITDLDIYRKNCFYASIPTLEKIFQREIPFPEIFGGKVEPEIFVYRKGSQEGEVFYEPSGLSFEQKVRKLAMDAFYPLPRLPVDDFIIDLSLFCSTKTSLIELDTHYHVIKGDFRIDPRGDVVGIPEIFIHFHTNLRVVHQIILSEILEYVSQSGMEDSIAQFEAYRNSFPAFFNQDPEREEERLREIETILASLTVTGGLPEELKNTYDKLRYACKILRNILLSIPKLREEAIELLLEESLQKFIQRISQGSKEKKILQVVRVSKTPEVEAILDKELSTKMEVSISNYIHNNFGYYEESSEGKRIFQVIDPKYLSGVILNHALLSKTGEIALKQYRTALKIEYILKDGVLRHSIDTGFTPKELTKIKEGLREISDEVKKKKLIEEKLSKFNQNAAIGSGILSIFLFLALYKAFKSIFLIIIALPVSVAFAFYMGKQFRKKKLEYFDDEPDREKDNMNKKRTPPPKKEEPTLFSLIEPVIFPNSYKSIMERIYTAKKLKKSIKENYKALKIKAGQYLEGLSDEIGMDTLESAVQEACSVVQVPKDKIPKNQPAIYYFNKKDLETPKTKSAILTYFKKVSEKVDPPDPGIKNYYDLIINIINKSA